MQISRTPKTFPVSEQHTKLYIQHLVFSVKDYPQGWPQLAALLYHNDNLAIFRRFGLTHCRVLLHLQAEIQLLEQKLSDLDHADSMPGSPNAWRLRTADFKGHWDPDQRDILKQLQEKLLVYGERF
jgi:hypothetical protein